MAAFRWIQRRPRSSGLQQAVVSDQLPQTPQFRVGSDHVAPAGWFDRDLGIYLDSDQGWKNLGF